MATLPNMKTTKNARLAILALVICSAFVGCKNDWPKEANREAVMADAESTEVLNPPPLNHLFVVRKSDGSSPQTPTDEADNFHNHDEKQHRGEVGNPIRLFRFHFKASCQAS